MAAGDKMGATVEVPSIKVEVSTDAPSGELLVVALHAAAKPEGEDSAPDAEEEDDKPLPLPSSLTDLDAALSGALTDLLNDGTFTGAAGSSTPILRLPSTCAVKRVALVGLGKAGGAKANDALRDAGAFAIQSGLALKAASTVWLTFADLASEAGLAAVAEGAHLTMFSDDRFKGTLKASVAAAKKRGERLPTQLTVSGVSVGADGVGAAVGRGAALAAGVTMTKQLVAAPANVVTPTALAETAEGLAAAFPDMECEILEQSDCEALGMGSFLAVGRGSVEPPKFIHMTYKPAGGKPVKKVCLIGKGITFDSGGYNIKAGAGSMIALMKVRVGAWQGWAGETEVGCCSTRARRRHGGGGDCRCRRHWATASPSLVSCSTAEPSRPAFVWLVCEDELSQCAGGCTEGMSGRSGRPAVGCRYTADNALLSILRLLVLVLLAFVIAPFLGLGHPCLSFHSARSLTWAAVAPSLARRAPLQSSSPTWRSTSSSLRARIWCRQTRTGRGISSRRATARPLRLETPMRVRFRLWVGWVLAESREVAAA